MLSPAPVNMYPHMTSIASRLARHGVLECVCMLWSAPISLACCSILLHVVVVDAVGYGGVLVIFCIPLCMSAIFVVCMGHGVVGFGISGLWPCAQSADGRVRCREDDIRSFLTLNYVAGPLICCIVVFNTGVGLDFANVCRMSLYISLS